MKSHRFLLAIKTQKNGEWLDKIATQIVSCPEEAAVKMVTLSDSLENGYKTVGQLYKMDFENLKLVEVDVPEIEFKYKDK